MRFFTPLALLAAALLSAIAVVPFLPANRPHSDQLFFEASIASTTAGHVQLYYDAGTGLSEAASSRLPLASGPSPQLYRLPLPYGVYRAFRFDPNDRDGTVTVSAVRVVDRAGRVRREIAPAEFKPANQISSLRASAGGLEIVIAPGGDDSQLALPFDPPLDVRYDFISASEDFFLRFAGVWVALAALLFLLDRRPGLPAAWTQAVGRLAARPGWAVSLVAAAAVIASAYPVVFLGRSFVSPNLGTTLLYENFPTLPGYTSSETTDVKGSDIGAIMWAHIPYSMVEHRALGDGELPLWNRYNSGGTPLLAQGQSMFGDPLHFLVLAADGAAWAWDLKFLIAKWLFAAGLGLTVLAVARHLPAALIVAVAAPFMGFFLYRLNHPAFFSVCYAPVVFYCWVRLAGAGPTWPVAGWALGLTVANAALMNSGTVKEAYMLLLSINLGGALVVVAAADPWRIRLARLAGGLWGGALLVLLSAPVWLSFLDTLHRAYTAYNTASAYQIQPGFLLGVFDELFYRPLSKEDLVFNPSVNFVILLGLLYFLATLQRHFSSRASMAVAIGSLLPLALAFGLVPPEWIVRLPFLGNVAHIDNSFTCPLLVFWSVLAGVGFAEAGRSLGTREGRDDLVVAGLLLFALVFCWIASGQAVLRPAHGDDATVTFIKSGQPLPVSRFIWISLGAMLVASGTLAVSLQRARARGELTPATTFVVAACALVLLWRAGLQPGNSGFDDYTAHPLVRVDFHARSEAMEIMQASQATEPTRGIGLQGNFFPGWTAVYGLEGVSGPDALMLPAYRELTGVGPIERIWDWRLYLTRTTLPAARPFLDFLNVRYYFDLPGNQAEPGASLKLIRHGDLDVYESATVWPRAFFTDRILSYDQPAQLVERIAHGDGRPFAGALSSDLATEPELVAMPRDLPARSVEPASDYRLTQNTTAFTVHAARAGVIVLTEAWSRGDFQATLNGQAAPVLRLNHAFKGVYVPAAGDYRAIFRYVPRRFSLALGLVVAGFILLAAGLATAWKLDPRALSPVR